MNEHVSRLEDGLAWEIKLSHQLERWGWAVAPFGVSTLPGVVSLGRVHDGGPPPGALYKALLRFRHPVTGEPSGLRWFPDMIAGRGDELCLIDAKSERAPSVNYAVDYHALQVSRTLDSSLSTPVFFVWPDGGVLTPRDFGRHEPSVQLMPGSAAGSGTPFFLIPKRYATPANEVFGTGG